jgi:hypothetical protein
MDKTGKTNGVLLLVVVGVVAYFLIFGLPGAKTPTTPTTPSGGSAAGYCAADSIKFDAKITELGKSGTNLATADNDYFILTNKLGKYAASAEATVPTNYDMQIMYGENSTTHYTVVKTLNTGCVNPTFGVAELALADTSLNSFYFDNSDGSVNTVSNTQAMAGDDSFETTVHFKAGADTYFGNPSSKCQNVAVIEYDKTYIKMASGDNPTAVPGFFTYKNSTYDGANAFFIPKSGSGEAVTANIKIESTSSDVPSTSPPVVHLYDCDIDKNEDSLTLIEGVEDEDLNAISLAAQQQFVYLS